MDKLFFVALGGSVGSVVRFLVSNAMKTAWPAYASSGTLLVNVAGSLLIGFLLGTASESKGLSDSMTGFLGGLTTFSSLAHETVQLSMREGDTSLTVGLSHLTANVLLGLAAVWCGVWLRQ